MWGKEGAKTDQAEQVAECRPLLSTLKLPQALGLLPKGKPIFKVYHIHKSHLAACVAAYCSFSHLLKHFLPLSLLFICFSFPPNPLSMGCSLSLLLDSALQIWEISLPYKYCLVLLPLLLMPSYPTWCLYELFYFLFLVQCYFCWNRLMDPLERQKNIVTKYDLVFAHQKKGKGDIAKAY